MFAETQTADALGDQYGIEEVSLKETCGYFAAAVTLDPAIQPMCASEQLKHVIISTRKSSILLSTLYISNMTLFPICLQYILTSITLQLMPACIARKVCGYLAFRVVQCHSSNFTLLRVFLIKF